MTVSHPYHLVKPSILPFTTALSAFLLFFSAVLFFHNIFIGKILFTISLFLVFYNMYRWWVNVIKEAKDDKAHNVIVQKGLKIGMSLFILSEVMFFFAFFFAFFYSAIFPMDILDGSWGVKKGIWPPKEIKIIDPWNIPFFNTLILLLSGTSVTWAHYALLNDNNKDLVRGLKYTVILGVIFTSLQVYEYAHALHHNFAFKDNVYSSLFYMATGFHGFHVIVGTIFLTVCYFRAKKGSLLKSHHLGFEFAAWYWHFVDVVWLFLFVSVYIWGS